MVFQGTFFYLLGSGGIFVKWSGKADYWPEDEAGPGYWDYDLGDIETSLIGLDQYAPKSLSKYDIDDELWELIVERAEKELRDAHLEFKRGLNDYPKIQWPKEVNF